MPGLPERTVKCGPLVLTGPRLCSSPFANADKDTVLLWLVNKHGLTVSVYNEADVDHFSYAYLKERGTNGGEPKAEDI